MVVSEPIIIILNHISLIQISTYNLSQRTYTCNYCGFVIDRDKNAAINLDTIGQELADIKPVDPNDCQLDAVMAILMGIDTKQEATRTLV